MNPSKPIQRICASPPPIAPAIPLDASSAISRNIISPAYIFPNNRSECDSGFDTYSIRLKSRLNATRSGAAHHGRTPNGDA